jgi:predicted restriction endonuclease
VGLINKNITIFVNKNTNKHLCACGCGKFIEVNRTHFRLGIPKYILGHNSIANREKIRETVLNYFKTEAGRLQAKKHGIFFKKYRKTHKIKKPTRTKEQILKHAELLKEKYKNGELEPWNKYKINVYGNKTLKKMRLAKLGRTGKLAPMFGKHHSLETKNKLRIAKLGHVPGNKGKKASKETRKRLSLSHGGTGIPYENTEYGAVFDSTLKEKIRFIGNYKCKLCGCSQLENGRLLDVHHIDYDKKNNVVGNLVALCRHCHIKTNYKRDYWRLLFKQGICHVKRLV